MLINNPNRRVLFWSVLGKEPKFTTFGRFSFATLGCFNAVRIVNFSRNNKEILRHVFKFLIFSGAGSVGCVCVEHCQVKGDNCCRDNHAV